MAFHVIGENGVTEETIQDQLFTMRKYLQPAGIDFEMVSANFHKIQGSQCVSPFSYSDDQWFYEILSMKKKFAQTPENALNIFINCQVFRRQLSRSLLLSPPIKISPIFFWDLEPFLGTRMPSQVIFLGKISRNQSSEVFG